jgi:nucleotide-binding universal stress UspA family protein
MIRLLAYTDGRPAASKALGFAAALAKRLEAQLAVITVRSGTHAAEDPPPVGGALPLARRADLPRGMHVLVQAAETLAVAGVLEMPAAITIRDIPKGHMFVCNAPGGRRIAFYECFGHLVETLNREVDEHGYHLLIIAQPRRGRWGDRIVGNPARKLALDLHTSLLVVRGGGPDSRYLVCTDGSASSRRQLPLLRQLLPAIASPLQLLWVRRPGRPAAEVLAARESLDQVAGWLARCGKPPAVQATEGEGVAERILAAAGEDAVIMLGASLRHDVYRRLVGSLPLRILARTPSSVLLAKRPPEEDCDGIGDLSGCP